MASTSRYALFPLRLGLAAVFVYYGSLKVFIRPEQEADFMQAIGLPGPSALVLGLGELCIGLAMLTGLCTRLAAALAAGIMIGAILMVKLQYTFEIWSFDFLILAAATLGLAGPGEPNLATVLARRSKSAPSA